MLGERRGWGVDGTGGIEVDVDVAAITGRAVSVVVGRIAWVLAQAVRIITENNDITF